MAQAQTSSQQETGFPEWLNFDSFRKEGMSHIGQLSGNLWTDHNAHDPGITILEVLCYALTDLGYRNQFDASALFARKPVESDRTDDNFFSPAEILSVNPLSLKDFKRLLLEIPGVRNAWLKPVDHQELAFYVDRSEEKLTFKQQSPTNEGVKIKGLYEVYIDLEESTPQYGNAAKQDIASETVLAAVWQLLQSHRTLCEDFKSVEVMERENVWFCMEVDLTPGAEPEAVFIEIFEAVQQFLTPSIRFYTLQEMLDKQKNIEEIFEGRPLLKGADGVMQSNGFIDPDELSGLDPKENLHISDIYKIILAQLPGNGVRAIRSLKFFTDKNKGDEWVISLDPTKSPYLLAESCQIFYSKGQLPIAFDTSNARLKLNPRLANYHKIRRQPYELGATIPQGKYYDFADYTSIQREFPKVYGINENQLPVVPPRASEEEREAILLRRRQALQLKGYLAFFDQMLANYLAQLANVRKLFAVRPQEVSSSTYFNAEMTSMPDAELILGRMELRSGKFASGSHLFRGRPLATLVLSPRNKKTVYADFKGSFTTSDLRDSAVYFFQKAFESDTILLEIIDRWAQEDRDISPCDRYFFIYRLPGSDAALCSRDFYETEEAAMEAAELLRFLGILTRCYKNKDKANGFKSQIIYNPMDYSAFLDYITETPERFHRRREKFLNHLLARFSEQFTEYTLLMYALDGQTKSQDEVIKDKMRFLSRYDDISRNRAKAFDYTRSPVWDTDNVSGFEQRVAGFMGLDDWKRRTINHLKLTGSQTQDFTQWSFANTPLFQTPQQIADADYLKNLFKKENIVRTDCPEESIYGFRLNDPDTGQETSYLFDFVGPAERDEALEFWMDYFSGKRVNPVERNDRFCFIIKGFDDEIVLKGLQRFKKKKAVKKAFYQAVQWALDLDNYEDAADEAGHYFRLLDLDKKSVAVCLGRFADENKRNVEKERFVQLLQQRWLRYSIRETEKFLDWQVLSTSGEVLFISTLRHQSHDTSGVFETIWQALKWARQSNGWRVTADETGAFYLSLRKTDSIARLFLTSEKPQNWIQIGRSPQTYPTEHAASLALEQLQNALTQPTCIERALVLGKDKQYRIQLVFPNESEAILNGLDAFSKKAEAAACFEQFLKKAAHPENYQMRNDGYLIVHIGNGKSAISANPFPVVNADELIRQLANKISGLHAQMTALKEQKGEFYHNIQIPKKHAGTYHTLIGKKRYPSENAAFRSLPLLLSMVRDGGLWTSDSEPSEGWRFLLSKGEKVYAEADQEYVKKPSWRLPGELRSEADWVGDSYRYRIGFLDCACRFQYLLSTEGNYFDTAEAALAAGNEALEILKEECPKQAAPAGKSKASKKAAADAAPVSSLVALEGALSIVACADQQVLASYVPSPPYYQLDLLKNQAFLFLTQPLVFKSGTPASIPIQADYAPDEIQTLQPLLPIDRFRLRDENYSIAWYHTTFSTADERETAANDFLEYWKKAIRFFPDIDFATIIKETGTVPEKNCAPCNQEPSVKPFGYYFRFKCESAFHTLIGFDRFAEESEVQKQISDAALVAFMNLMAEEEAYVVKDISDNGTSFELQVFDYQKIGFHPKLVVQQKYSSNREACGARKAIINCVKAYPFYLNEEGKICFRLYNRLMKRYDWLSTQCYDSISAAQAAFREFLRLLAYPANIRRTTKPFSLNVGEIMLESSGAYVPTINEFIDCPQKIKEETKVWTSGVEEQLLARIFEEGGVVVADTGACGYTFRVVGSTYRLASHPFRYRTAAERTAHLKAIRALYTCGRTPRSVLIKGVITSAYNEKIEKNGEEYFLDHDRVVRFDLGIVDELDVAVSWHRVIGNDNSVDSANAWYALTPWAEYPEFYHKKAQTGEDDTFGLFLVDEDGKELAYASVNGSHKMNSVTADSAIRTTLLQAREHPVKQQRPTRSDDKPTNIYKIYSRYWQPRAVRETYGISGAYIWESTIQPSNNPEDYFNKCYGVWLELASLAASGYQNTRESDCGDFSFNAVDVNQVIAYYPAQFGTRCEAEAGIKRMLQLIDVEGFHVIENILLRPIRHVTGLPLDKVLLSLPKDLTALWSQAFRISKGYEKDDFNSCFENHLPGSDPYSAQVTIVLPYWAKRFQNSRFREFFENTLRRELPAHCRLRTIWAPPYDMYLFEKAYKAWLTGMAAGEGEQYKADLVEYLSEIKSYYKLILDDPKAFLNTATLS